MPDRLSPRSRDIIISGALPKRLSGEELQAQQQRQLDNRNALLAQIQAISGDFYDRMLISAALRNRDTENPPTKPYPFSRNRYSSWVLQWVDEDRITRNKGYEQYDLDYTVGKNATVASANRLVVSFGETQYVKPHTKVTIETDKRKYVTDVIVRWRDDLHYDTHSLLAANASFERWYGRRKSPGIDFIDSFCSFTNSFNRGDDRVKDGYSFRLGNDPKLSIYRFVLFIGVRPIWWVTTFHYDAANNQFLRPLNDKDRERCMFLGVSDDDIMKIDTYLAVLRETLGLVRTSQ